MALTQAITRLAAGLTPFKILVLPFILRCSRACSNETRSPGSAISFHSLSIKHAGMPCTEDDDDDDDDYDDDNVPCRITSWS